MHIVVPLKQSPDLVEELEVNAEGNDIDRQGLKLQVSEWDEQALEEALCLKEASGANVTAITADWGGADLVLFTALAKGADRALKLVGDFSTTMLDNHRLARALASTVEQLGANLVLTGVQSVEDLDGQIPVLLAAMLGWPHVSVVTGVELTADAAQVKQEHSGGLVAELEVKLPAVLGVQAARRAPRYAPVSKVRQMQKGAKLEQLSVAAQDAGSGLKVRRVFKPQVAARAEILEGTAEEIAAKLLAVLRERGLSL
jgi:electron transfer flavoprotein beta subunit